MIYQSSILSLPLEIQQRIIKELDPLDVVELLQSAPHLSHLFQLVVCQDEPFFFSNVPESIKRVSLEDFDTLKHRALFTLVDMRHPFELDIESALKPFSQTINFFAIDMENHYNEISTMKLLDTILPSSKVILVHANVEIDISLIQDPQRITIKDTKGLVVNITDPEPTSFIQLKNVESLQITDISSSLLSSLDLSVEPKEDFSIDNFDDSTPFHKIINRHIAALSRTNLACTCHVENVTFGCDLLCSYLSPREKEQPPLIKSIKAPSAKIVQFYSGMRIPMIADLELPVVETIVDYTTAAETEDGEFADYILKLLEFPTLKSFSVKSSRSNALFVRDGELLKKLELLRICVPSTGLSEVANNVDLPNLKTLVMSLEGDEDITSNPLPKIAAPNLTELDITSTTLIGDDHDVLELLEMYRNLNELKLLFHGEGSKIDVSSSIRRLRKNLKSITLCGTTIDFLAELEFPVLEILSVTGDTDIEHFAMDSSAPMLKEMMCVPTGAKTVTISGFPLLEQVTKESGSFRNNTFADLPELLSVDLYCSTEKIKGSNLPKLETINFLLPGNGIRPEHMVDFTNVNREVELVAEPGFEWQ